MKLRRRTHSPRERLLRLIDMRGPTECWPYSGGLGSWGYGSFWLEGRNINASRAAYILLVGPVADGIVVCHACDIPACCNPAHLWLGTPGDNVRDCNKKGRAKGRFTDLKGIAHPRLTAKLTPDLVRKARTWHDVDGLSNCEIARRMGVNNTTIRSLVLRKTWTHIE